MSVFPLWFYFGMLSTMKWPRKAGLRRREIVDCEVAELVLSQLGDLGRSIGASHQEEGLALIADMYTKRDWERDDMDDFIEMFVEEHERGPGGFVERDAAGTYHSVAASAAIRWKELNDLINLNNIAGWFAAELWYGACHAEDVGRMFDDALRDEEARQKRAVAAGLITESGAHGLSPAADMAEASLNSVRAWEAEEGVPLPPCPAPLLEQWKRLK